MQGVWDPAPTKPAKDGRKIRIPGDVVPIDEARSETSEFLPVPRFGACIHAPPPPSNAIIRALPTPAGRHWRTLEAVCVSGRLDAARSESDMGSSNWRLQALPVEPCAERAR